MADSFVDWNGPYDDMDVGQPAQWGDENTVWPDPECDGPQEPLDVPDS